MQLHKLHSSDALTHHVTVSVCAVFDITVWNISERKEKILHQCTVKVHRVLWLTRRRLVHHFFFWQRRQWQRHLQAPLPCCSASYFILTHHFQESPHSSLSVSLHHLHPSICCRSLSAGLSLLYVRHTWAVASVWKWSSFAFKHSDLWALGKLDERRTRGMEWGGGEKEGEWREEREWKRVCGEHWLI